MKKKLVLASGSKQRQDILKMLGLKFEVLKSKTEEKSDAISPDEYVRDLSFDKAMSVKEQLTKKAVIIAADTIIYCDGKVYEKPKSLEEAAENIRELSGKTNTAYTGITIIDLYSEAILSFATSVDIKFRDVSEAEIEWYVQNEPKVLKCCGYVPQGKAAIFVESVSNGDYNTIIGLSPSEICKAFSELGLSITDFEMESEIIEKQ